MECKCSDGDGDCDVLLGCRAVGPEGPDGEGTDGTRSEDREFIAGVSVVVVWQ